MALRKTLCISMPKLGRFVTSGGVSYHFLWSVWFTTDIGANKPVRYFRNTCAHRDKM